MRPILAALGVLVCLIPAQARTDEVTNRANTVRLLWQDPGRIADRDLHWGVGSEARAPKPPFVFLREDVSGTKPKLDVKDAAGVTWSVKLATVTPAQNEVHAEIAATRLVWALGYFVDENYFVARGRIDGVKDLKRAADVVGADGTFQRARFERRPPDAQPAGNWHLEDNRFKGSRELAGLHSLMMLIGNWDHTEGNTIVLRVPLPTGDVEERYLVSDLGSTFGRMRGGANQAPSRWNLTDFIAEKPLSGVAMKRVQFRHPLMGNAPLSLDLEHARWFAAMLSQLSDRQVRQAFDASGASAAEAAAFSGELMKRIAEFRRIAG
jgi:hypothetical protein